ncbi:MAG TPA: hypothetical protein DEV93_13235 [Chloroflexi bacterium]|nr:hypothetical protein [Chloroflexota bacterium]
MDSSHERPPHIAVRAPHDPSLSISSALALGAVSLAVAAPGSIFGAALTAAWWRFRNAPMPWRLITVLLSSVTTLFLWTVIVWGWPYRIALALATHTTTTPLLGRLFNSSLAEATAGPLLALLVAESRRYWARSIPGHLAQQRRREMARSKALSRDTRRGVYGLGSPRAAPTELAGHPPGSIRLGEDTETGQPFDLTLAELGLHVFIPGASGMGKTTTLACLADGCIAGEWSVAFVDCKGTGLLPTPKKLAASYQLPIFVVDPEDPANTFGYNPCTGDGPAVSNKLVGAFAFGADAQIYSQISLDVTSVAVDAMRRAGRPVTLASLITVLSRGGLAALAADLPPDDEAHSDLLDLDSLPPSDITKKGIEGMRARLRSLASGRFGPVFRAEPALDWETVTTEQTVTFFGLPTTAAPEDVALMGRVIAQDIKQLCGRRLRAVMEGEDVRPLFLIVDEFAALGEAQQFVDLLLQARQARITLALATQLLPKEDSIRKPALQSGVLIIHRLEAEDADKLAAEFGTHATIKPTYAPAQNAEETDRVSLRSVEEFNVHPNDIKGLTQQGRAVVRSVTTNRQAIIQVYRKP